METKSENKKQKNFEYNSREIANIICSLREKNYLIPNFQRDYVWNNEETIYLLNSILNNDPIGYGILWKTHDHISNLDSFIDLVFDEKSKEQRDRYYILDGQQRLTTLSIFFESPNLKEKIDQNENKNQKYKKIKRIINNISFNIEDNCFEKTNKEKNNQIPSHVFFNYDNLKSTGCRNYLKDRNIDEEKLDLWIDSITNIKNFYFGFIIIEGRDFDEAVNIFNKINVRGKKLDITEIIHSQWTTIGVDIRDEFKNKIEDKVLVQYGFKNLKINTFIDSLYLVLESEPIIKGQEKINHKILETHKNVWDNFIETFKNTIKFLNENGYDFKTIPSENIIKWVSYFIYKTGDSYRNADFYEKIKKYIVLISLEERYSSSTNEKLLKDIEFINNLISNDSDKINKTFNELKKFKFTPQILIEHGYSEKGMICRLVYNYFKNNSKELVVGTNTKNKNPDDLNIHHIFPKKAKKDKKYYKDIWDDINSLANLILIDENDNKKIKSLQPSEYKEEFNISNEVLENNMIDIEAFKNNDFETFMNIRSEKLADELNKYFKLND